MSDNLTPEQQNRLRLSEATFELSKFIMKMFRQWHLTVPELVTILLHTALSYQKEESKRK